MPSGAGASGVVKKSPKPNNSGANNGGASGKGKQQLAAAVADLSKKSKDKDNNKAAAEPQDADINSGFGEYLRSPQAVEMMKLFVIANTMVVFFTMAWPQMKHSYEIITSFFSGEDDEL